ncbi:MAG TPA: NADH-quinone oxidoreductase subunit J [Actinomycetota bacterium]|nr:NADH-quinone oxidoreductase subunit J [Actinomycetota bacterium]
MNGPEIIFTALAVIAAVAGILVVTTKNVVRGALYLVAVLGSIAAIFMLLGAEFIGWTQVLIYVGAIVVLLLFGLMLTRAPIGAARSVDNQQRGLALVVSASVFGVLTYLIWRGFGDKEIPLKQVVRTEDIGNSMFSNFILPFEAISILLLAALVGAIVLARRDK